MRSRQPHVANVSRTNARAARSWSAVRGKWAVARIDCSLTAQVAPNPIRATHGQGQTAPRSSSSPGTGRSSSGRGLTPGVASAPLSGTGRSSSGTGRSSVVTGSTSTTGRSSSGIGAGSAMSLRVPRLRAFDARHDPCQHHRRFRSATARETSRCPWRRTMAPPEEFEPQNFTLTTRREGERGIVALTGELDLHTADQLTAAVTTLLDQHVTAIEVDAGSLSFADSAGLRAVLTARAAAQRAGASFGVTEASEPVARLIEITGLSEMLRAD